MKRSDFTGASPTKEAWPPSTIDSQKIAIHMVKKATQGFTSEESAVCLVKMRPITIVMEKINKIVE